MKKLIDMDEEIWRRFERVAVERFGIYGAITQGVNVAIAQWVRQEEILLGFPQPKKKEREI
jgi:hypothetical protein